MDWLTNLIEGIRALPSGRQAVLGATAFGSLGFLLWIAYGAATPDYRAAYRGLPEEEIARVAQLLREERIEYKLDEGGTTILVPAPMVYEARIRAAGRGLPNGGSAGFELFDQPAFGVTDFVHRVNYTRAMQGELARSVEQLEPVERARVQVVIPERKSVLASAERKPRAAVIARLRPGRQLEPGQVRAIVHLVASSVESLDPSDVTIVDGSGRLLTTQGEDIAGGELPAGGAPAYQQRVESDLAHRIEAILSKTIGPGGVIARVRADMDFVERQTTEEIFDPDSQIARSEQRTSETSNEGNPSEGGVAGVAANTPGIASAGGSGGSKSNSNRSSETINFEINKKVSRQTKPMGEIERLSIAVLIADKPPIEEGGEPVPWDDESISLFTNLARQAVGFDEKRGDQITVSSAPFRTPGAEIPEDGFLTPQVLFLIGMVVRVIAVVLALFLFARLVIQPVLETVKTAAPTPLPARVSDMEAAAALPASGAAGQLSEGAIDQGPIAAVQTDEGVQTLRNWLNQE
ncbi:MAG: flagellar M-ring protein FliF [bacterium]|nr:flagellar M-ring protein FliF [bacterium]MCP5067351.1 flagellar M-ring protein FliF [bacterium]